MSAQPSKNPMDPPTLDDTVLTALDDLAPDEPAFLEQLIDTFLDRTRDLIDGLADASSKGDERAIERISHEFCSSSAQLGALHASRLARRVVNATRSKEEEKDSDLDALCKELGSAMEAALIELRRWRSEAGRD